MRSRAFAKTNRHFDEGTTVTAVETVAFSLRDVYQRAGPAFFFLYIIIILKQHFGFPGRLLTAHASLRKSSSGRDELRLTSRRLSRSPAKVRAAWENIPNLTSPHVPLGESPSPRLVSLSTWPVWQRRRISIFRLRVSFQAYIPNAVDHRRYGLSRPPTLPC